MTDHTGPEAVTLERHYRVTLDFRLLVRAITPEVCGESFFFHDESPSAGGPHFRENVERQKRLYELLLGNRPALEAYLLSVLTQEAGDFAYTGLGDAFDAKEEEEILTPLYKGMADEDMRFFDECREVGALAENTELIERAFKVEWTGAEIAEMSRRSEGDVRRAEVVAQTKSRFIRRLNSPG